MHPKIERFLERPWSHKLALWAVSLALVFGGFWNFLYSGRVEERDELTQHIDRTNSEIVLARRQARELPRLREEIQSLDLKLEGVLKQLPDKQEIEKLLVSLERKANESGLEGVSSFRDMGEQFKDFYAEIPIPIEFEGSYHEIATFFDEVGRLPRIVNVTDISLSEPFVSEEGVSLRVKCKLVTYRYLTEAERLQAAEAEKQKATTKKRRR